MSVTIQTPAAARAAAGLPGAAIDVPMNDLDQARLHLRALHEHGQLVELRRKVDPGMQAGFFTTPEAATGLAVTTGAHTDVYVGVLPRTRQAGGRDALPTTGRWLWAECDTPMAVERALNLNLSPSMFIRTSPGKAHCYWPLIAGLPLDVLEMANRRLAWHLGADLRACDAARILRVAGTRNHKYADRPRVSITYLSDDLLSVDVAPLVDPLPDPAPSRPIPARDVRRAARGGGAYPTDREKDALLAISAREYVWVLAGREVYHHMARCPFHNEGQERTPSLHVAGPNETLYHCFGCDEGGDVFSFAARLWGLDTQRDFSAIKDRLKAMLR